jgi:hypothetical protein
MLCLDCGAEMHLVQVTKDTTMLVSGYEHHTWQCSGCSTIEQRMTFTPEKSPTQIAPTEPAQTMLVEPTETAPGQLTETVPVEPTQTVPVEPSQAVSVEPTKTTSVEPIQTVSSEPTHPEPPAAMPKMSARAKALDEKLRNLKERAKVAREAAGETARPTQFNRDLDNEPRPVPQSSASSDASSHVEPDERLRSPTEPIASPAPTSHVAPIAHQSSAPAVTNLRERLRELVRAMRQLSIVR